MPAFTPHLNLYKPGGGSTGTITPDEVFDVDRHNQNYDDIDSWASDTDARLDDIEDIPTTHARAVRRVMGADNFFNNQVSFADFPQAADAAAMQINFTKQKDSTLLLVTMQGTGEYTTGSARNHYLALSINGTDYDVAQYYFPNAVNRNLMVGTAEITGVAAGTHVVKPRFRSSGAAQLYFRASNDFVAYSIMEVE